eukprot:15266591-Alexandrium_andersonii.AAC.1
MFAGAPRPPPPADWPDREGHSRASDAASHEGANAPVTGSEDSSEGCSGLPAAPCTAVRPGAPCAGLRSVGTVHAAARRPGERNG